MDVSLTASAASVVDGLAPAMRAVIGRFLRQDMPKFVETHDPVRIGALDGKYWVVRPSDEADQPTFLITRRPAGTDGVDQQLIVVAAIVPGENLDAQASPPDPADIALGVEVYGSVQPAT